MDNETFTGQPGLSSREYERARFAVPHHILRSEVIYGEGFQSPGGLAAFKQTVQPELPLSPGKRILDIGSGLGGAAFYLANEYAVEVVGVDTAEVMISIVKSRKSRLDPSNSTQFVYGNVFSDTLEPASFDAIYSQDTFMYEADKPKAFARCAKLLKPGGVLIINDFCEGRRTAEFDEYVEVSGLHLVTVPVYEEMVKNAGFVDIKARDISPATAQRLQHDLNVYLASAGSDSSIAETDVQHLVERWRRKIGLLEVGALAQGLLCAIIPGDQ